QRPAAAAGHAGGRQTMNSCLRFAVVVSLGVGLLAWVPGCARRQAPDGVPVVRVGSKAFTESAVLGEVLCHLVRDAGAPAEHKARLGDTLLTWTKLRQGDIDVYCEYTGTLTQEILAGQKVHDEEALATALAGEGLRMSRSLGFNNTYALGMKKDRAEALHIRTILDLKNHPEL